MNAAVTKSRYTRRDIVENALREIAASAVAKGGDWASEQAFAMLELLESPLYADASEPQS
jgi:hypothetical protein